LEKTRSHLGKIFLHPQNSALRTATVVVRSLSNPADPYFLGWWLLQQLLRRKVFSRFKRI